MGMLICLAVVVFSQFMRISRHQVVNLKYISFLHVKDFSMKLLEYKNKRKEKKSRNKILGYCLLSDDDMSVVFSSPLTGLELFIWW